MNFSNPAAERGILAGIAKYNKEAYLDVNDIVSSKNFTIDLNSGLFTCFSHIFEKNIETKIDLHIVLSTINELHLEKLFQEDNTYIQRVLNFEIDFNNIRSLAKKIKKLTIAKEFFNKHNETQQDLKGITGEETVSEIISMSEQKVLEYANSLSANNHEGVTLIGEGLDEYLKDLKDNPRELVGISTGWPRLDRAMGGGMRRQTVTIIAARPNIGKTLIADTVGLFVSRKINIPVLELDSEMSKNGHWPRLLAALSGIPIDDIETGKFGRTQADLNKIREARTILKSLPFSYVNVSGKEFDEIISIMRRWIMQTVGFNKQGQVNDCLIIYDYFKLMNDSELKSGVMKEHQILGFNVTKLHDFVVKYDVPCLSFVQVNRDGITKETSDVLADSDRILRYVDNVFLYKVKDQDEIAEDKGPQNGNRKMIWIKTRYGAGLDPEDYINLKHTKNIAKIEELKTRNEIHAAQSVSVETDECPAF